MCFVCYMKFISILWMRCLEPLHLLLKQWFGDAEKLTKALFSFASRLAPVIIFVDEVSFLK